jgi:uncharacterized protein (UPF0332 family)
MITEKERQEYIQYRLGKAEQTFQDAVLLAQHGSWDACANRLYYACFYAVTALLLQNGHPTQTHKGAKILFTQHFVKTALISTEQGYLFVELFDKRQAGDYADLVDWTEDDILPLVEPTRAFVETIKVMLEAKSQ